MHKGNNVWSLSLSASSEVPTNPLPFIEERKQSLLTHEQERHLHRNRNAFPHELTEPPSFNDKVFRKDNPCLVQREVNNYKKKVLVVPPRITHNHQLYDTMEEACLRTQIKINHNLDKNRSLFASVQKNTGKSAKLKGNNDRSTNRIYVHQSKKKTKKEGREDKLRPIISESHLCSCEPYFLNVEKMVLVEGERSKKSQSVIINNCSTEEKVPAKLEKFFPNSQLIKEINVIKEKFNIQRILQINECSTEPKSQNFHNFINIKSYDKQKESCKTQQRTKREESEESLQLKMSTILEIVQLNQQPPVVQQREERRGEAAVVRKKSPTKRRRKFTAPFETYYYRDLLWKVNYTNSLYVQVPIEYEHRLKVFVGKGNNSCMVSGLIARRHWYAFTERAEDANFIWSQLKILQFYRKQTEFTQEVSQSLPSGTYQSDSILTATDSEQYNNYITTYASSEQHSDERLLTRSKAFRYKKQVKTGEIREQKMQNHLINNYVIGNKKALFNTMTNYYKSTGEQVFDHLPLTFHIKDGLEDKKYFQFLRYYHKRSKEVSRNNQDKEKEKQYNAWIVKPGENSNRGNGIKVCLTLEEIKAVLKVRESYCDGTYRTYIVQAYIEKPLLYFKRKLDLRHYMMISCINGRVKGYWYKQGYVRTTSSEYSLSLSDGSVHLTNDAVQKQLPEYGKYEKGNKISYDDLNAYIEKYHKKKKVSFYSHIYPKMKKIATDTIRACSGGIDPQKLMSNFEVFGLDFMIDANLDVWLIEVNSNPCLELSCPLLASLIPKMVENTLQLTMDALFPPPLRYCPKGVHYFKELEKENKYELVYDERVEPLFKGSLEFLDNRLLEEEDDTFEDCGDDWEDA